MENIVKHIEQYVTVLYGEKSSYKLPFHSLIHTQEVVKASLFLSENYQLNEQQQFIITAASWFHDVGYLFTGPLEHEVKSAEVAGHFLSEIGVTNDIVIKIQDCIHATKVPQSPRDLLEEIVCDADLFHLGGSHFHEFSKLLQLEIEFLTGQSISGNEWRQQNILLLKNHRYHTEYANTLQSRGQADNLQQLQDKHGKKLLERPSTQLPDTVNVGLADSGADRKLKDKGQDRGVQTMFKTTSTNHLRLSEIADSKANIMISVNSIMISVLVSLLVHRLDKNPHLIIPTALFIVTSLLTIIFAIMATRPNVSEGTFNKDDVQQRKVNLLFFGNFYNMSLEEYEQGMNSLLNDSQFLYGSMTRDIYQLGVVLGRKYKLLRICYNVFLFGFVVSILSFLYFTLKVTLGY